MTISIPVKKKSISDYQKFITQEGVEKSQGISLKDFGFHNAEVQSIHFVHAPREDVNEEFPGYAYGGYLIELKLNKNLLLEQRDAMFKTLTKTVEFRTAQSWDNKNSVNVYEGGEQESIILIATCNPETLMEYLETRAIALEKTASSGLKILHNEVWPEFKAKYTKMRA